jgi:hypothetical protein
MQEMDEYIREYNNTLPPNGHPLYRVLVRYASPSQDSYDPAFAAKVRALGYGKKRG